MNYERAIDELQHPYLMQHSRAKFAHRHHVEVVSVEVKGMVPVNQRALIHQHHLYTLAQAHLKNVRTVAVVSVAWWILYFQDTTPEK